MGMLQVVPRGTWQLEKAEKHKKTEKTSALVIKFFSLMFCAESESRVVDRPVARTYRCDKNENDVATMEVSNSLVRGLVRPHWD